MDKVRLDFIVMGLPRSGTTWLANLLTTDRSLCLHDPFGMGMPCAWPGDGRARGISCTGAYLMRKWVDAYDCPKVVIERDTADCDASLRKMGLPETAMIQDAFHRVPAVRFQFENLWDEEPMSALWAYLLPSIPFDRLRYRLLRDMQVQPYMPSIHPDEEVMHHLLDSGTLTLSTEN